MKKIQFLHLLLAFSLLLGGCASKVEPTPPPAAEEPPAVTTVTQETAPPDEIELLMAEMTVEEKVGQLFLVACAESTAIADLETYHLGGYILFAKDFSGETPETLKATLAAYQEAAKIPLLIAVDEEGGVVTRLSNYDAFRSSPFPAPRKLYAAGGLDNLLETEREKCELLRSLGINVNMAPVCDIATDPSAFMYPRSLGLQPEETGSVIARMVALMHDYGVGSVLKHFPGYGNNADTHVAAAVDSRSLEELATVDLVPFAAGMEAGCGAVLVSHTIVETIDPELPASLSPAVHQYLRQEMSYEGVIVTDSLTMAAITQTYGAGESAVLAVLAGNDLLCSGQYHAQYEAVLTAVEEGRISQELLNSAVERVLSWKQQLGLI